LTRRDRSIVTIAALIARDLTLPMPYYFNHAFDNGVKSRELSEIISILRFIRAGRTVCGDWTGAGYLCLARDRA
jgi:alkylhydroperoxidase/carboxymuconolactone decarboxylase family protein YurZ